MESNGLLYFAAPQHRFSGLDMIPGMYIHVHNLSLRICNTGMIRQLYINGRMPAFHRDVPGSNPSRHTFFI